jgi:hypothetical protein
MQRQYVAGSDLESPLRHFALESVWLSSKGSSLILLIRSGFSQTTDIERDIMTYSFSYVQ